MSTFSERQGLSVPDAEIAVRNEAPDELRDVLPTFCYHAGLRPRELRAWLCDLFLKAPDKNNWSDPNVDSEARHLLLDCEWFEVYDAIEMICRQLSHRVHNGEPASGLFADKINRYFRRTGIGWQLANGLVEIRGPEAFEAAIRQGRDVLLSLRKQTAATELHEAIVDLSRRPNAEITGAIQHALAALECVARDKCISKDTLGDVVRRNPGLFPRPLDELVQKAWGWSSNFGRHLEEGSSPTFEDAELMVGLSGVLCRYLARKL